MTDLEITKACAEAMGFVVVAMIDGAVRLSPKCPYAVGVRIAEGKKAPRWYSPLHDDAKAMALVKKFQLDIIRGKDEHGTDNVLVSSRKSHAYNSNLNRAICECVAKMQEKK